MTVLCRMLNIFMLNGFLLRISRCPARTPRMSACVSARGSYTLIGQAMPESIGSAHRDCKPQNEIGR